MRVPRIPAPRSVLTVALAVLLLASVFVAAVVVPLFGPTRSFPGRQGVTASPIHRTAPASAKLASDTHPDVAGAPDPFGAAQSHGNAPEDLVRPVVGMASTSDGGGYWMVASDGGVFAFADARYEGSMGGKPLAKPIVGMSASPVGAPPADQGYRLVASDGGVFDFGAAGFYGSMGGKPLDAPIVGIASTNDGKGYWLVASDGGVFAFGDAAYHGSMGGRHLNAPVVGIAPSNDDGGYWLVASDGGVFSFGDAIYRGSMGDTHLVSPVVGIATSSGGVGAGYWMVAADGGVFSFDEPFYGSLGGSRLANPVIAIAAVPGGSGYWILPTTPPPPKSPPSTCGAGFVCGHVTAIGDSVMLDVQPDLVADIPGVDVEAAVSRQWDEGIALVQEMRAAGSLGSIVVIDLGTNGPVDAGQFQQMMSALSGASLVVFVTVHLPPSYSWWQSVNQTLEAGVPMFADARLADFNALADQNPEWFGSDGVHMPVGGPGAQAMARLIADTI
jgi:hypothetical protein